MIERQARYTESMVTIMAIGKIFIARAFRNSPWNMILSGEFLLRADRCFRAVIEHGIRINFEPEIGHQVFKCCTCPGSQDWLVLELCIHAPQFKPTFLRDVALRDRAEYRCASFRGEQVVMALAEKAFAGIVADRKHFLLIVV